MLVAKSMGYGDALDTSWAAVKWGVRKVGEQIPGVRQIISPPKDWSDVASPVIGSVGSTAGRAAITGTSVGGAMAKGATGIGAITTGANVVGNVIYLVGKSLFTTNEANAAEIPASMLPKNVEAISPEEFNIQTAQYTPPPASAYQQIPVVITPTESGASSYIDFGPQINEPPSIIQTPVEQVVAQVSNIKAKETTPDQANKDLIDWINASHSEAGVGYSPYPISIYSE